MTPQHAPHDAANATATNHHPSSGGDQRNTGAGETVLLPSRAPREDKYHRPGAPESQLPACGTFESVGVETDRAEARKRGYRRCRLCWSHINGHADGCDAQ